MLMFAASKTVPEALPQSSDCEPSNTYLFRGNAARGNATRSGQQRGLNIQPKGNMRAMLGGRRSSGNRSPPDDDEIMLWVGPILYFSAPMDISNRDKRMKESKVNSWGAPGLDVGMGFEHSWTDLPDNLSLGVPCRPRLHCIQNIAHVTPGRSPHKHNADKQALPMRIAYRHLIMAAPTCKILVGCVLFRAEPPLMHEPTPVLFNALHIYTMTVLVWYDCSQAPFTTSRNSGAGKARAHNIGAMLVSAGSSTGTGTTKEAPQSPGGSPWCIPYQVESILCCYLH
jgi:hypothetical protein